jgi:putative ABC transport system permease protein
MDHLLEDIRYSLRSLAAAPGFLTVAAATIAVGIGATTAIFSVVHAVLLRPLPYPEPDRLVFVRGALSARGVTDWPISPRILLDMRERADLIEQLEGEFTFSGTLIDDQDEAVRITAAGVTPGLFSLLGVRPALGRGFQTDDAAPLAGDVDPSAIPPAAVILSYDTWERQFGGDENVVGRFIQLFGNQVEVVGVMAPGFKLLMPADSRMVSDVDAWFTPRVDMVNYDRRQAMFEVVGRLRDGATLGQAQAQIDGVVAFVHDISPSGKGAGYDLRVVGMQQDVDAEVRPVLLALLGTVFFVLLIACANVSNLMLVRASSRTRDTAVRAALGASRTRVVRQMLTESFVLASIGTLAGVVLAYFGIHGLLALGPPEFPRMDTVSIDATVLAFALVATVGVALLFGLVPAARAGRTDVAEVLKQGGRSAAVGRTGSLRTGVVVAEVALSVVLLIGAGLMIRSFIALQRSDPGFDTDSALTFQVQVQGYDREQRRIFMDALRDRLGALPGVQSVTAATMPPLMGTSALGRYGTREALSDDALYGQAVYRLVYPDYFRTMGTRLLEGRDFDASDFAGDGATTVIVDRIVAARLWPDESPIGQTLVIRRGPEPEFVQVVGVVDHERSESPAFDSQEAVYFNARWGGDPGTAGWVVRTAGVEPTSLVPSVRAAVTELDPHVLVTDLRSMQQVVREVTAPTRFALVLIGIFAALALGLAGIGVYGVLSYIVRERRAEIGMRMVLGAQQSTILGMVIRQGLAPIVTGTLLGLVGAFWLTRFMASLLVHVEPFDPLTFVAMATLFGVIGLMAAIVPARRAARVHPMEALRDT